MTSENFLSQLRGMPMQFADRYTDYAGPVHDQNIYFPYEHSSPQGHTPILSKPHFGGGGHKSNAAMTALTLLAFLFFLHILQQCLKEHMTALNTPQVMIMTGGREGEENIAKISRKKLDKTGESEKGDEHKRKISNSDVVAGTPNDGNERYLMKITSSDNAPWKKSQNIYNHDIRGTNGY